MSRAAFGLMLLAIIGCNRSREIPITTAPVTGTATFEGKPLEGYRVFFYTSESAAQQPSTGQIDPDGKFVLTTRHQNDGAIVGKNQVWFVYDPEMPPTDAAATAEPPLPPPKVKLPEKYLSRDSSGLTVDVPATGLAGYALELK